jgi:hypothetical protein
LDFDAECQETDSITATWTTASEIQNKQFVIEQSENAINWSTVGEQAGAGNSNSVIRYEHTFMPLNKGASYLRLKQIDLNGQIKTFDPIYINCTKTFENNFSMSPNPANDFTEITFTADADGQVVLSVYSLSGQLLKQHTVNFRKGYSTFRIEMSELPAGVYYMNLNSSNAMQFNGNRTLLKR